MRKPSIHLLREDLIDLLSQIVPVNRKLLEKTTDEFMAHAAKKAISTRSITISNDKLKKEVSKRLVTSKGDADLLANIIYSIRIKKRHRGVKQLTQDDRDWPQLKKLAELINGFCNEFNLEKRQGYIYYIELGMSKISSMHSYLSKLINMYESICTEFDGQLELINDKDKSGTMAMHDIFCEIASERTGIPFDYSNQPNKMIHFMKAREISDEYNANYEDYIIAQFEALDFCNGLPTPEQLSGDKAVERLSRYLYKSGGKAKSNKSMDNVSDDVWKQLKN